MYRRLVTPTEPGPDLDAARAAVVRRELTGPAIGALTDMVRGLPFEALTPVKQLLKRFFSDEPWTAGDDDALAIAVGAGNTNDEARIELAADLAVTWGWPAGRFLLRVTSGEALAVSSAIEPSAGDAVVTDAVAPPANDLEPSFASEVVPEVTPSPRTIRFAPTALHEGASRFYNSATEAGDDERAVRLFRDCPDVTAVLVGPDFLAVTILHADDWDALLAPILRVVTEEFASDALDDGDGAPSGSASAIGVVDRGRASASSENVPEIDIGGERTTALRGPTRLERAWAELGALRATRPGDLERIVAAGSDTEPAARQVSAALLADAPPEIAVEHWERLAHDPNRAVRRSAIDAVVDAQREALRPLLERALADPDAWTRWKALHGLAILGAVASRTAIEACLTDPDFRVRLEAERALTAEPD